MTHLNKHIESQKVGIPDALIAHDLGAAKSLECYGAAKSGSVEAAAEVANALVDESLIAQIAGLAKGKNPILQPVYALESTGRNVIPAAAAKRAAKRLGLDVGSTIVQATSVKRTSMQGLERIFHRPKFFGDVEKGRAYLLLDDTLTQGGTFAALERHITAGGGRVIGAVALTGKQYSARLRLTDDTLSKLRANHGDIEHHFRAETGYGFDELTESEGRYLAGPKLSAAVRDRILAGATQEGPRAAGQAGVDVADLARRLGNILGAGDPIPPSTASRRHP
jgi:hypothetical protein